MSFVVTGLFFAAVVLAVVFSTAAAFVAGCLLVASVAVTVPAATFGVGDFLAEVFAGAFFADGFVTAVVAVTSRADVFLVAAFFAGAFRTVTFCAGAF